MVILGVDPGLQATGYGIIETRSPRLHVLTAGDIRPPRSPKLPERLAFIHETLSRLISRYRAETVVLEQLFTHHAHVTTAALMAHARGVACLAAEEHRLPLAEYPPTRVKKSVTGNGAASKEQVARMLGQWLDAIDPSWSADATDALALAVVHAHAARQRKCQTLHKARKVSDTFSEVAG